MKKLIMVIIGLVLALSLVGAGFAAQAPATQAVCPVLGNKINKNIYADYQGKRVYFCCSGCVAPFKKNPEKYLKKMEEQGITPETSSGGK